MRNFRRTLTLALAVGVAGELNAQGAELLASVTCSGPLKVRGASVAAVAARFIALGAGDEVETLAYGAVIVFPDRSRLTLEPGTRVSLGVRENRAAACVQPGAPSQGPTSGMQLCAGPTVVAAAGSGGTIPVKNSQVLQGNAEKGSDHRDDGSDDRDGRPGPPHHPPPRSRHHP